MNEKKLVFRLLLLFPITTIFQTGLLVWVNQILFAIIFPLMLRIRFIDKKINKNEMIIYLIMIGNYIYALFRTQWPLYQINSLFYFMFTVLYSLFIRDGYMDLILYFKEDKGYILNIIRTWTFIVGFSIFLPVSYKFSWGDSLYFTSFTDSTFRLSPTAFMILVLALNNFFVNKERKSLIYSIVPLYCFYMGGSRTFLAVGLLTFYIVWYLYLPKPAYFYWSVIPLSILAFLAIFFTAAGNKIAATTYSESSYFDYWGTVTNGRTIFWLTDLKNFNSEGFWDRLLGCGFNYVFDVNLKYWNVPIWAHNDLINVLLNFGYVGVMLYSYSIAKVFSIAKVAKAKVPAVLLTLMFLIWFITAMFNMYYTYFCSLIAFPLLVALVSNRFENKVQDQRDNQSLETIDFDYRETIK